MAFGTAIIDFGAYPGKAHATVTVPTATIQATSLVEVWFANGSTAEHNADEHKVAPMDIDITYSDIVVNTEFKAQCFVRRGRAYGRYNLNWAWA